MIQFTEILKNGNALNILLAGVLIYVLVKARFLRVHTEHIQLGAHEDERAIMRRQLEYAREALKSSVRLFPKDMELDPTYTDNVLHNICDLFEDMIVFNHIKDDNEYIGVKQTAVYNKVIAITRKEYFMTPEFHQLCDDSVASIIKTLVRIRRTYKNQ